eukprot:10456-Heterococcus_DN1.PRE.5
MRIAYSHTALSAHERLQLPLGQHVNSAEQFRIAAVHVNTHTHLTSRMRLGHNLTQTSAAICTNVLNIYQCVSIHRDTCVRTWRIASASCHVTSSQLSLLLPLRSVYARSCIRLVLLLTTTLAAALRTQLYQHQSYYKCAISSEHHKMRQPSRSQASSLTALTYRSADACGNQKKH